MVTPHSRQQPFSIQKPNLLLVEGDDDFHFFRRLIEERPGPDLQIIDYRGKDKLGAFLNNTLVLDPRFTSVVKMLGITRDADTSYDAAMQSVQDSLRRADLPVPHRPLEFAELAPRYPSLRVVTFILPDNGTQGDLESLYLQAIGDAPAMACVNRYIECLKSRGNDLRQERKKRLWAYLASNSDDPTIMPGQAIGSGMIPWDSPAFDGVHQFLNLLDAAN